MQTIRFSVAGECAAKGSLKAFTFKGKDGRSHTRLTEQLEKSKPWRELVAGVAAGHMRGRELFRNVPLDVRISFGFTRPKSHFGAKGLKAGAPLAVTRAPDLDKLARNVGDALKGIVFEDDALIAHWDAWKIYVPPGAQTGMVIRLEPVSVAALAEVLDEYCSGMGVALAAKPAEQHELGFTDGGF